jgi:hypothetical protein
MRAERRDGLLAAAETWDSYADRCACIGRTEVAAMLGQTVETRAMRQKLWCGEARRAGAP